MTDLSVTCVIPTHHRPELLRRSLTSVLAQNYVDPVQVIVVDDAGDPATAQVVADVARNASLPIIHEIFPSSDGAGSAGRSRNRGARLAQTPLLAFLDDDDEWGPDYLSEMVSTLGPHDVVVCWMSRRHPDGRVEPFMSMPPRAAVGNVIGWNPGLTGSNFLIRREAFVRLGGFDESLAVSNDKDFLVRVLDANLAYGVVTKRHVVQVMHEGDQLTDWNERRLAGMEAYYAKHGRRGTWVARRHLRRQMASIRWRISGQGRARWAAGLSLLLNSSWQEYRGTVQRLRPRRRSGC